MFVVGQKRIMILDLPLSRALMLILLLYVKLISPVRTKSKSTDTPGMDITVLIYIEMRLKHLVVLVFSSKTQFPSYLTLK